jgi:hypothetical protein
MLLWAHHVAALALASGPSGAPMRTTRGAGTDDVLLNAQECKLLRLSMV